MPVSKSKQEEAQEKPTKSSSLTRRGVLKAGAAAGALTVITSRKSVAWDDVPPEPVVCSPNPPTSPETTPFLQALPIPSPAVPKLLLNPFPTLSANVSHGEAARADHQRWFQFYPLVQYDIDMKPALHQFHPEIPPTYVWGFDGKVPGPTFLAFYGIPMLVRFRNKLPFNHTGFGSNTTTIHLHNGHTASESDGFAGDYYDPGLFKDFHYPNIYAGYDEYPPNGDVREAMHTFWYHDHRHSFTSPNNYRGLNGMFFLYDNIDTGIENDPRSTALRLPAPYGVHDIPLIFRDAKFCPDGQLFSANPGGTPAGDKFIVNGSIQPYFQVRRRKYRFRMLNTGTTRIYNFTLNTGTPLKVIATDGNLLEHPIDVSSMTLDVSSRMDVILDFSQNNIGDQVYLLNNQQQFVNNAPEPNPLPPGVPSIRNVVMRFDVIGDPLLPDNSQVPATLCEYPPVNLNEIVRTRTWNFDLVAGQFQINGKVFDPDRSDANILRGTTERWIIRNKLPLAGWTHPVHIHFEEGRILSRNGAPPPPLETGRRDVYTIPGNNEVEIFLRFRNFSGKYMIHCHNMNHEDGFMLVRWTIVDDPSQVTETP
jgi:FtsP/CotA-like multicopper oxidase with cupredoxin domain